MLPARWITVPITLGAMMPDPAARAERFERGRKKYWTRREFAAFRVQATGADDKVRSALAALGFRVAAAATE